MNTITKTIFKVGDFVGWAQAGLLDLRPNFQRRAVWKKGAKSYLIDTVLRGLPIPIVFLRDRLAIQSITTTRELVDGQQRLRTILGYINPGLINDYNLELDHFKISKAHNPDFAGLAFASLPLAQQQAIIGYEIPVHVFSADTEDRDILQIFARMNATGVKLNDQELRNANWFGEFKSLTYALAYQNLNRWQEWGVFSLGDISRMAEVEEVADLIISMHEGIHAKNKAILDRYYEDFDLQYSVGPQVDRRFEAVMSAIEGQIGSDLVDLEFSRRVLFNDLFVATYHMMYGLGSPLDRNVKVKKLPSNFMDTVKKISSDLREGDLDPELAKSLRGATAHKNSRLQRVVFLLEAFGYEFEEG